MENIMPIDAVPDWEMRIRRTDAFWAHAVIDRPLVHITCPKPGAVPPPPWALRRQWCDPESYARTILAAVEATEYYGDALPTCFPNIGPDLFPVLYGGDLHFEDYTSFIDHFVTDWARVPGLHCDFGNVYGRAIDAMYDALLELGRGRFYVGWPDLHPGADCLAGWRGPAELCMDLYDHPEEVKAALAKVTADLFEIYDRYTDRLVRADQPVTGWPGLVSTRRWHVPSCDFSYMIAPELFREFILPGLRRESEYFEASLHHLDGVGCLNHLDAILEIERLNAIQWIPGDSHGSAKEWIPVYRKIQAAGKGLQIYAWLADLETLMTELRPEGVQLYIHDVPDRATAEAVLKRVERWK